MKKYILLLLSVFLQLHLLAQNPEYTLDRGHTINVWADEGKVYVPLHQKYSNNKKKNTMQIEVFDITNGKLLETIQAPEQYVKNTNLYIRVANGHIYFNYTPIKETQNHLAKYDIAQKSEVWNYAYPYHHTVNRPPIMLGKYMACLNPYGLGIIEEETGKEINYQRTPSMGATLGIYDGKLFTSMFDGTTHCKDFKTQKVLWSFDVGSATGLGSPVFFEDKMVISSWDARVYCLDINSGKKIWEYLRDDIKHGCGTGFGYAPIPYKEHLLISHSVNGLFVLDRNTGKELKNVATARTSDEGRLYKERYLVIRSAEQIEIYDAEKMEIIKKVKLPFKVYNASISGKYLVLETPNDYLFESRNTPNYIGNGAKYENKILVYDLEKFISE